MSPSPWGIEVKIWKSKETGSKYTTYRKPLNQNKTEISYLIPEHSKEVFEQLNHSDQPDITKLENLKNYLSINSPRIPMNWLNKSPVFEDTSKKLMNYWMEINELLFWARRLVDSDHNEVVILTCG